jgi:hypothetical protein
MTVTKIEIKSSNDSDATIFGLANSVLVGVPSTLLNSLISSSGGAPIAVKAIVASPAIVGDFVFSMKEEGGGYSFSGSGLSNFVVNGTVQFAVATAINTAAVGLGATVGIPLTAVVGIGTAVWMAINNPLVNDITNGVTNSVINALNAIKEHWNNGTLDEAFLDALDKAIHEINQTTNGIAETILDWLDGLAGTPDDAFPISDAITAMVNWFENAFSTPIVLDLNNNGIEYIKNDSLSNVFFDIDADGFAEKTEWIKPTDGFLVRDLNGNGKIDSQAEMFGDNGGTSAYAKLASLNSNNTGASANALTSADAAWNTLRVWQDLNSNGKTDAGELKTLSSLGITSVGLQSSTVTSLAGHKVAGTSTFVKSGVTQKAADVVFDVDQENSWWLGGASEIKAEALFVPLSRGYGEVKSLHFAVSENATLMTQVKSLATMTIAG